MSEIETTSVPVPAQVDYLLRIPNISIDGTVEDPTMLAEVRFCPNIMKALVRQVALANPTWSFLLKPTHTKPNSSYPGTVRVDDVVVHQGADKLGEITCEFYRGDYVVGIRSHRAKTSRGVQRSSDIARAMGLFKKLMSPRNLDERVREAQSDAQQVLNHKHWTFNNKRSEAASALTAEMREFALANEGAFITYLTEVKRNPELVKKIDVYKEAALHMLTVETVKTHFNKGKTALVLLDSGEYIVKMNGSLKMYTDTTLPEFMRGRLGMLKLVEEGQVVSDVGCRVNPNVFVVVSEGEPNAVE